MILKTNNFHIKTFYRTADGLYSSYWSGKFINSFMHGGNKQTIEVALKQTYASIKFYYRVAPVDLLLESLERIKPLFGMGYVVVAGKRREFPYLLAEDRQFNFAVRWLYESILSRKEWYLSQRMLYGLYDTRYSKSPESAKKRDKVFALAIENRFNARYITA